MSSGGVETNNQLPAGSDCPECSKASAQPFRSLLVPCFRTLWFGMLFNVSSMQVNFVARSWLAYKLSGSGSRDRH